MCVQANVLIIATTEQVEEHARRLKKGPLIPAWAVIAREGANLSGYRFDVVHVISDLSIHEDPDTWDTWDTWLQKQVRVRMNDGALIIKHADCSIADVIKIAERQAAIGGYIPTTQSDRPDAFIIGYSRILGMLLKHMIPIEVQTFLSGAGARERLLSIVQSIRELGTHPVAIASDAFLTMARTLVPSEFADIKIEAEPTYTKVVLNPTLHGLSTEHVVSIALLVELHRLPYSDVRIVA